MGKIKTAVTKLTNNNKGLARLYFLSCLLCILPLFTFAETDTPKVNYYHSDNKTNQIPYFDNRFHIDANINEIKLVFYRKQGSQPVILVMPNGTKIKANKLPNDDSVQWFDDTTYDLIHIKKPMAGPWQAIGQIVPGSQILVVSDVKIEATPLPEILLAGETLKVTGKLVNGEKGLADPLFRAVVNLDVDFYSSNNKMFDNFGAAPIKMSTFLDDGVDFDEKAGDGIYTGEFVFNFAPGEWLPLYHVKMPLVKRELRQKPVILQKAPINITVKAGNEIGTKHRVSFTIDPTYVDANSIILQGKITYPDKQDTPFSILEDKSDTRRKLFEYGEAGIHRINVDVFGKTINGREFFLTLPEFTFNAEDINGKLIASIDENGNEIFIPRKTTAELLAEKKAQKEAELAAEKARLKAQEDAEQKLLYTLIAIINGLILFIGISVFLFLLWRKKKKAKETAPE